jgi:hypothetical protein
MTAVGEGVRKIENVSLLATDIRWKKLGEQEKAHHSAPSVASESVQRLAPAVQKITRLESRTARSSGNATVPIDANGVLVRIQFVSLETSTTKV